MKKYNNEEKAVEVWEKMECKCSGDNLCKQCAIKQAADDGYYFHEICFDCCQPLEYCTCSKGE